jgi:hypothetical protein
MNNSIWVSALLLFATGYVLTSCDSTGQKLETAEINVISAQKELTLARQNYLADVEIYQQYTAEQIAANSKKIDRLKSKMAEAKNESKTDYRETIDKLEEVNRELKLRMDNYHEKSIKSWEAFKIDLSNDMEKLGAVMKDLTFNSN